MPAFDTPAPISVSLRIDKGVIRITAGSRPDTVVEVTPANKADEADRRAAEQTRVVYTDGELTVEGPRKQRLFGSVGSVEATMTLPAGSSLAGDCEMAALYCIGELGACTFATRYGDIRLEHVGRLRLDSGYGDVTVEGAADGAAVRAGSGTVRIGTVIGPLTLDNGNGAGRVAEVTGPLSVTSANGDITVGVAHSAVTVRASRGDIRIGEAVRGRLDLTTAAGEIEVGVRRSAAAWLDVRTRSRTGQVRNTLGDTQTLVPGDADLRVHALTSSGDVLVRPA
ncbi:DUF4097 family beta strand repeat-containing protein [Streptomyces sp. YIM 98790]|uniref:DUF4097 family beta strand repeat-containing protein n=1 Tax=Streptomyces sp. YIM 98790 TaxID=2689077 RepID=UPI00140A3776|nr:DUF4097 family beta strand repeat-containing protein [Streptomyces sp. YIM 98790]